MSLVKIIRAFDLNPSWKRDGDVIELREIESKSSDLAIVDMVFFEEERANKTFRKGRAEIDGRLARLGNNARILDRVDVIRRQLFDQVRPPERSLLSESETLILKLALECDDDADACQVLSDQILITGWKDLHVIEMITSRAANDWAGRIIGQLWDQDDRRKSLSNTWTYQDLFFNFASGLLPIQKHKHVVWRAMRQRWARAIAARLLFRCFDEAPWRV